MFALVDCNNFYVSCERAFNPRLEKKPVIILSNNDGCIISRSNEAKKLGIPMGAPFYQWKLFCNRHQVHVFSSNYELYGDMSRRVMALLGEFNQEMEIYSIDEAFLWLQKNMTLQEMLFLRHKIKTCTGIPISIGVGQTKTLAKAANQIAKTCSDSDIFFIYPAQQNIHLATLPVERIWGIGHNLAKELKKLNIDTAKHLCDADLAMLRLNFSVSLEKTVRELKGEPCLRLEKHQPRKRIISSRSFGKAVTDLVELEEAISHYTNIAAEKLRKQQSVASAIYVFIQTNAFSNKQAQYGNGVMFSLPTPTADTRYLVSIAKKCLRHIYKKGYRYHKTGVMLLDIHQHKIRQFDMFMEVIDQKGERVMQAMDTINAAMGKNTVFLAAEGIKREWVIKCDKRSPRYTTRWQELPRVYC
ncbi:Y-family DNA polymerase [Aquicella lusitana]|uniref:DNA polymerase V n=1 Tax=Aquicella lusitana TaxID=254246 RepID=A0A370GJI6_9COXI|nr:Y-family DNA polymerase [Aquicella lusitana]RDI42093.1 DNA polymerase V [Aquicella lusitana]VVC74400.1 DNA polymerase IV [Aquicella lusitana]